MIRALVISAILLAGISTGYAQCLLSYDRDDYPHWRGGVRERVIVASSINVISESGNIQSYILDQYTGALLHVGTDRIDMDHIVPLKWAHDNGANCWDMATRLEFANDPLNMLPVSASANRRKGSRLFDYLPSKLAYCSAYLERITVILNKYDLGEVPGSFKDAIRACEMLKIGVKLSNLTPTL